MGRHSRHGVIITFTDEDIHVFDPEVAFVLFYLDDMELKVRGLRPTDVERWTKNIARGYVPLGFLSMQEFEEYIKRKLALNNKGH